MIHPYVVDLSRRIKSRKGRRVPIDPAARKHPLAWSSKVVPRELVPFFKKPSVEALVDAMTAHPWLYWHQLVHLQVVHLVTLHRAHSVDAAGDAAQQLLEAHVKWLRPDWRITPKLSPVKTGPKAGMENPFPAGAENNFIGPEQLWATWCDLKFVIDRLTKGNPLKRASRDVYIQIAHEALKSSRPAWSSRQPTIARKIIDDNGRLWFEYLDDPWDVDFGPVVKWLCEDKLPDWIRKEGRPARLAYAILGAVLAADPEQARVVARKVKDRIDAYQRQLRRSAQKSR